jgi:hypothetical protein
MSDEPFEQETQILWGDTQIPDARVITPNWIGDNELLPQKGTEIEFLPEHYIEYKKCKDSIHYFAENYYTITVGGNEKSLMKLWKIQKEALDYFIEHNRVVMNSSRQTSKTTLVVLFILWNLLFGDGLQKIGLLGNKYDLAKLNLDKVKESYELLPLFLKPHILRWNEKSILFTNNNECKIQATSSTSFRGSTLTSLVIDEAAFINEGGANDLDKAILQSLLPTLDAMAFSEHGDNSFCILVSTPFGMNNEFAKKYHQAMEYAKTGDPKIETPFHAFEMLWSDHPERDEEWFRKKVAEMGSLEAFYVEFGGSFTMGDDAKKAIDTDINIFQNENNISKPILTQTKLLDNDNDAEDESLKIWELPKVDRIYAAGVDIAEGVGACYSTIQIFDFTDLKDIRQVAEYRNNIISTTEFPLVCLQIFNAYNQCYAAIEQNNSGREVISSLVNAHGYKKLVRYHSNAESMKRMVVNGEYGVVSHASSKNKAVANMRHFLNVAQVVTIRSEVLLTELNGFVQVMGKSNNWTWQKQGGADSYDDTVDGFNWCLMMLHAQLVETYFDVDKFDKYSKPTHLLGEIIKYDDHRKHNLGMPLNDKTPDVPIYTSSGGMEQDVSDMFDVSWLQNF